MAAQYISHQSFRDSGYEYYLNEYVSALFLIKYLHNNELYHHWLTQVAQNVLYVLFFFQKYFIAEKLSH